MLTCLTVSIWLSYTIVITYVDSLNIPERES
jgi:hypothetical protein